MNNLKLFSWIRCWMREDKKRVCLISDGADWVLDRVAVYLKKNLESQKITVDIEKAGSPNELSSVLGRYKNSIIHFCSRYALLQVDDPYSDLSNSIYLTWFHGERDDPDMKPLFFRLLKIQKSLKGIVTSCEASRSELVRAGVDARKITIIPIGVDTTHFQPVSAEEKRKAKKKLKIPDNAFCIGSFQKDGCGWGDGMEPKRVKGPDVFVRVLAEAKKRIPDLFVLLTGPSRGYVKTALDKEGIPYHHYLVEDYKEIRSYYHALDLYLITARCEGGPKGFMESWATGVPVVSTCMGMPADLIRSGENGWLADVDDAEGLTRGVMAMVESPELRENCIRCGLDEVAELDWRKVADQHYEKLYKEIVEGYGKNKTDCF